MRTVVLGIQLLEICFNYELFYNAQSYPPLLALLKRANRLRCICLYNCFKHHIDTFHIIRLLFNTHFL